MSLMSGVLHISLTSSIDLHNYCVCFLYLVVYCVLYVIFVNESEIVHILLLLVEFSLTTGSLVIKRRELPIRIVYVLIQHYGSHPK
jgi:hypothetical protein